MTQRETGWAILVESFKGPGRHQHAQELVLHLARQVKALDPRSIDELGLTHVYAGQFPSHTDPAALEQLHQLRHLEINGERPFAHAQLVPLGPMSADSLHPWDLSEHRDLYSLQVGYFDIDYGDDCRRAAELEVDRLRAKGEEAFFWHLPHRSYVTVGLFDDDDFEIIHGVAVYGSQIRELQERFPYHLANEKPVMEDHDGRQVKQRCKVGRVP